MPITRAPHCRHPALVGTPKGVWNSEAVGKVRGYPRTEEAFEVRCVTLKTTSDRARAAGRTSRKDIPNGWAGRREEVQQLRDKATEDAWELARVLNRTAQLADEMLPEERLNELQADSRQGKTRTEGGVMALVYVMSVVLSPAYFTGDRLRATRIVLPFLVPKPAKGRLKVGLDDGLAFLAGLAEEDSAPQ